MFEIASGCLIIGEVGLAHDGSLGTAHAFIDSVADAGADAVKFQTHIASAESTPAEPFRVEFSPEDDTRYDYWVRTGFTVEQWAGLSEHARERDLVFLSSPFSLEAAKLLEELEMPMWKIASGEVATPGMLDFILATGKPVLLSTGMSSFDEVGSIVSRVRSSGNELVVMQCTTAYPCPPEKVGLNVLEEFRSRFDCPVGLSDHSGTVYPGLAAVTLGAVAVEVHVTFSRAMFGPDARASLTFDELEDLVRGIRFIESMQAHPVDKDRVAAEMEPLRAVFTKSLVARTDLPAGTVLEAEHLAAKKPGTGISAERLDEVVGARLRRSVSADELLQEDDLEAVVGDPGESG